MKKLIMMVGLPGSGKTTFLNSISSNELHISRDEVRRHIGIESGNFFGKEDIVFKTWVQEIKDALDNSYDKVYADATHLNVASRQKLLRSLDLDENIEIIAIVINTPAEICKIRNSKRPDGIRVPDDTMDSMIKNFSIPTLDEGFDTIMIVD